MMPHLAQTDKHDLSVVHFYISFLTRLILGMGQGVYNVDVGKAPQGTTT